MKIGVTLIGLEKILTKETKGKIIHNGRILFKNYKNLKSALIIYDLIKYFKFNNVNDIFNNVDKIKFKGSFRVDCNREGEHKFSSQDIREKIGEILYNYGNKVSLDNPKNIFYVDIIDNYCFFGLNYLKFKRGYKVRSSNDSLNSVLAYSLLKIADYNKDKVLLDPFCSDGTILIEAGLLKGKKLYGLSQDIKNASINSKVAKVKINLYDHNLTWLDTLFKKNSVDLIITKPLMPSKTKSVNFVDKLTKDLFHQASYILKGKMILLCNKIDLIEKYAKIYKFKIKEELKIKIGDSIYKVLSLKKAI